MHQPCDITRHIYFYISFTEHYSQNTANKTINFYVMESLQKTEQNKISKLHLINKYETMNTFM